MSWFSQGLRALGIGNKQTTTQQTLDPATQAYVQQMRQAAMQGVSSTILPNARDAFTNPGSGSWFTGPLQQTPGQMAAPFMNPYVQNVVDATRGEFDHLRGQASMGANQAATLAGAFGGSRHGVTEGVRLGALDRAQGQTIAGLLHGGHESAMSRGTDFAAYQQALEQQRRLEPLFRQQAAMGLFNMGLGPTPFSSSQSQSGMGMGEIAGLGLAAYGMFGKNPQQQMSMRPPGMLYG